MEADRFDSMLDAIEQSFDERAFSVHHGFHRSSCGTPGEEAAPRGLIVVGRRNLIEVVLLLALCASTAWQFLPESKHTSSPIEVDRWLRQLDDPDFSKMLVAAANLNLAAEQAIPGLLAKLDEDRFVKLRNSFDLIYPGATEFYGHGGVLNYPVDWTAARAGWVLETITLQDFGFRQMAFSRVDLEKPAAKLARREAGRRAKNWWATRSPQWQQIDGVEDALTSGSAIRQQQALRLLEEGDFWLGGKPCTGLTEASYRERIQPRVVALRNSPESAIRVLACALPPEPSRRKGHLTIHGFAPDQKTPLFEAVNESLGSPCSPWAKNRSGGATRHVDSNLCNDTSMLDVEGDRLELDGKVVARVGDAAGSVTSALGPPYLRDVRELQAEEKYPFESCDLIVQSDKGRITQFSLWTTANLSNLNPSSPPWAPSNRFH